MEELIEIAWTAIVIILGILLGRIFYWTVLQAFNRFNTEKNTFGQLVLQYTAEPMRITIAFFSILLVSGFLSEVSVINALFTQYLLAIIIILTSYLLSETFGAFIKWNYLNAQGIQKRLIDPSLLPFVRKVSRLIILLAGTGMALAIVGVDVTGLIAITSVIAVLLALASQETLLNIFAGLALQIDRPYQYGDILQSASGEILKLEKIGLRSTKMKDENNNWMIISNSEFAKQKILNYTKGQNTIPIASIEVSITKDIDSAKQIIQKELQKISDEGFIGKKFDAKIKKMTKDSYIIEATASVNDLKSLPEVRDRLINETYKQIMKL